MKNFYLTLFIPFVLLFNTSMANEVSELLENNGRMYEPGHEEPYTGKYVIYFESAQKRYEGNFLNGKMDGKQIKWHENGQKSYEANYKKGKEDGIVTSWDREGNITKTEILENGKVIKEIK